MESGMVKSFSHSNIELIKNYFKNNLPNYQIISESSHDPYWSVKFSNKEIEINIAGDIGFAIEIYIDNSKYDLWQYERSVNDAMKTSDKNILYQLDVLKRFLSESLT